MDTEAQSLHRGRLIDPNGNTIEPVCRGPHERSAESVVATFEQ